MSFSKKNGGRFIIDSQKKILVLYHSGAGSTKTLAEIYYKKLNPYFSDISSISLNFDYKKLGNYDFLIFAFPTYHCEPSSSMLEFIENMPMFQQPKRAFAFTTCGIYSGNSLRIFIKKILNKNVVVCGYSTYRAPATDGALILPAVPFMFNYEKEIALKIKLDINRTRQIIESKTAVLKYPRFKLYTILNFPNKVFGKAYKHDIKLLEEYCKRCDKCINNCIRNCWEQGEMYPQHNNKNCEFCFRCVHQCPSEAIIISAKTRKKRKFNDKFYKDLQEDIIQNIQSVEV